jgi:hypothetical protein
MPVFKHLYETYNHIAAGSAEKHSVQDAKHDVSSGKKFMLSFTKNGPLVLMGVFI